MSSETEGTPDEDEFDFEAFERDLDAMQEILKYRPVVTEPPIEVQLGLRRLTFFEAMFYRPH